MREIYMWGGKLFKARSLITKMRYASIEQIYESVTPLKTRA